MDEFQKKHFHEQKQTDIKHHGDIFNLPNWQKKFKSVKTQFLKTKNMYTLWKDSESIHQTYALKKCIV